MAEVLTANPHEQAAPFSSRPLSHSPPKNPSSFFLHSPTYSLSGVSSPSIPDPHPADIDMLPSQSTASSSPRQSNFSLSRASSFQSTAPSSVSLNGDQSSPDGDDKDNGSDEDDELLPIYSHGAYKNDHYTTTSAADESSVSASELASSTTDDDVPASPSFPHVADDSEARVEPSRQVDYLSHNWREEDIWSSWKHIVSRRKEYGERSRLENASWRTWAKSKNNLKTVSPERLNWLKDCDVTWLYGPLQQGSQGRHDTSSGTASCLAHSKNNSFINKKSNLKKRSVSEVMLQKSLSSSSLVKQAAAAVQAQRSSSCSNNDARPSLERGRSDFGPSTYRNKAPSDYSTVLTSNCSSEVHSPEAQSRRHIRFDTKVEQCIAVEFKETSSIQEEDMGEISEHALGSASSSSEDDLPMMKMRARAIPPRQTSQPTSSRNSFSNGEAKGIVKLPSTQIRFHADEAEEQQQQQLQQQQQHSASFFGLPASWRSSSNNDLPSLDKSPSQETLRPSKASANFFADDPELDNMMDWRSSNDNGPMRAGAHRSESPSDGVSSSVETLRAGDNPSSEEHKDGLRRTPSGMFMPFDESTDDEQLANVGMFGRVIDTVNTARDIAHVIWNVGWRK